MAWTAPRTWVPTELVTAALLNAHLRDNLLDLDARVTTAGSAGIAKTLLDAVGDIVYASANDTPARLPIGAAGRILAAVGGIPSWIPPRVEVVTTLPVSPANGETVLLRAGAATPYDFVLLTYDSTFGKWVSTPVQVASMSGETSGSATISSSFDDNASVKIAGRPFPWKVFDTAGLKPQGKLIVDAEGNSPQWAQARILYGRANIGDAGIINYSGGTIINGGASARKLIQSNWEDAVLGATPMDIAVYSINLGTTNAALPALFRHAVAWMRWVSK